MNYPKGIKQNIEVKNITYGNRGMGLEEDINLTNQYYADEKIAYIYKKPTPIQIIKLDYSKGKITEAYFKEPSTTDYNGIYDGNYIDFEAKETKNPNLFPLNNIHPHQTKHIRNCIDSKGVVFLIVRFTVLDKTFILMGKDYINFIDNNDRKSIPLSYFEEVGYLVPINYIPRLDYLKVLINKGELYGKH